MRSARTAARAALCAAWWHLLLYGEVGIFVLHGWRCSLPRKDPGDWRLAVIGDPQLTDWFSYGQAPGPLLWLTQHYSDQYMRRAYALAVLPQKPDAVLFIGDLFDGGRLLSASDFAEHLARFEAIFGAAAPSAGAPRQLFAAGNHDVGLGEAFSPRAEQLFAQHFGARNYVRRECGHDLVVVDAPSLTEREDAQPARKPSRADTWRFVDEVAARSERPRILFSHIPLWRKAECRSARQNLAAQGQKPSPRRGFGLSYQNLLSQHTSERLLRTLKPAVVLSGDHHDTCLVDHHEVPGAALPELTVATFSWLQGVRRPAVSYLHFTGCDGADGPRQPPLPALAICDLPDQLWVYELYAAAALASLIALVALHCSPRRVGEGRRLDSGPMLPQYRASADDARRTARFRGSPQHVKQLLFAEPADRDPDKRWASDRAARGPMQAVCRDAGALIAASLALYFTIAVVA